MLWYTLLAAQILLLVLNAQGTRRLHATYPGLGRRLAANCTNSCTFCAAAYKIEWSSRVDALVQTFTLMEVINTEDGSTSTTTITDGLNSFEIEQLSSSLSLSSAGPHISSVTDLDITITYPTAYLVIQDDYFWSGTILTDDSCVTSTNPAGQVKAPAPTPLPAPAFSEIAPSVTDTIGCFFDLNIIPFDDQLAPYFDDGAIKSCTSSCNNFLGFTKPTASLDPLTPPQLTVAFVTACQRSTQGADGVEKLVDCSPVKAPAPVAPTTTNGGGGSGDGEGRHTTTDARGSTIIVAGSATSGGGSGGRQTITDEHGSTVIVNGGSGGNLYTSINAQGQTIVATGAAGGQITLVNPDGSTVVIQGGTLASPGSGSGMTVTDERGSLMVVLGGQTGTLSVSQGEGTMLIAGTITQTSWVAGATISGGDSNSGSADPTVQNEAVLRLAPFSLIVSGLLFLVTVVVIAVL